MYTITIVISKEDRNKYLEKLNFVSIMAECKKQNGMIEKHKPASLASSRSISNALQPIPNN